MFSDTLILHLKRLEFDMETLRKLKVNDRCQFPRVLDMRPYTIEGLTPAEALQKQVQRIDAKPHLFAHVRSCLHQKWL